MTFHQVELSEEISFGSARRNAWGCKRAAGHVEHKTLSVKLGSDMDGFWRCAGAVRDKACG